MLVLTAVAAVDCGIPITGVYPQTVLFAVLAFVLFDPEVLPGTGGHHRSGRRIAAIGIPDHSVRRVPRQDPDRVRIWVRIPGLHAGFAIPGSGIMDSDSRLWIGMRD